MNRLPMPASRGFIPCLLVACWLHAAAAAADTLWDSRPYRVEILLELGDSGLSEPQQARLRGRLLDRLRNRLGRFWRVDFGNAAGASPDEQEPPAQTEKQATTGVSPVEPAPEANVDKRIACSVEMTAGAPRLLRVREHDLTLDHTGPERLRVAPSADVLDESLYRAITGVFRPLARFRRDPQSLGRVTLSYLAAELAPASGMGLVSEGQLLTPFTRRLKRGGEPAAGSATPVRWTYLVAEAPGETVGARVVSHSRRSLAGRAGGRVERLALAAPADDSKTTRLRLHSLADPETPLPGYEVLYGGTSRSQAKTLGYSDSRGMVRVPTGERVAYAHIRCGGLFVASLPVAPGVDEIVEVPLVDERFRLQAELEVTSLREQLVDTAARRQILSQRIKRAIDATRIDLAINLLEELDALPGRTHFARELDQVERQAPASHPAAQKRLDKLFGQTRLLVTKALDPRELRDLSQTVEQAKRTASTSDEEGAPGG